MSSTASGENKASNKSKPDWTGDSVPEYFEISATDLGKSILEGRKWRSKADITETPGEIVLKPSAEDSRRNSKKSGDHNILHQASEIIQHPDPEVDDLTEVYDFLNPPAQEKAVVNQGMSALDAVIPTLEQPIQEAEGEFTSVIYATEAENLEDVDSAIISKESFNEWEVTVERPLEKPNLEAGGIKFSHSSELGEHHNEHFNAVMDMAVGRGLPQNEEATSGDERNGELLLNNRLKLNKSVDWSNLEKLEFEKRDDKELLTYDIHAVYSGEIVESVMEYEEESTYLRDFESLESVQEYHGDDSHFPFTGIGAFTPLGIYANTLAAQSYFLRNARETSALYE